MNKIEYLIKHNRVIQFLYKIIFSTLFSFFSILTPIKKNLILFSSYSGKKFNDSPRVIYERMKKIGLLDSFEVVWAFDDPKKFEIENVQSVKINSFKYFRIAFRAKYWITNVNIERGLNFKKKKQIYLNTWHGTGPKTIGNAATGRKDYNFKKVNYLCADGEYLKNIFVRDLKANPSNIVLCGRPREDVLYTSDTKLKEEMMLKYGIKEDDFVILYAPTWREPAKSGGVSSFDFNLDIDKILKTFPNAKILFRAHSITSCINGMNEFNDRFISATEERDIENLFFISNVLITDYSSSVLDITTLNKPFICFAPDYDEYVKNRSLYFDLTKEYPFGVQKNTDDVVSVIRDILAGKDKVEEFKKLKEKYSPYGGNATNVCLDLLFKDNLNIGQGKE
ncbi:MAG: CDP-glycerol glycerophosphotransferase family protein [Bacilli bacterium]|nr:CDP-glycerol glycerophosphotransferase family protein [Bacilli bacterium]